TTPWTSSPSSARGCASASPWSASSGWPAADSSAKPDQPPDRVDQLRGVVTHAVLEDRLDLLDVGDVLRRVAVDDDEISLLARSDRADPVRDAQELRAVLRLDPDRLGRRESRLDEQLDFALVTEARQGPPDPCRIASREKRPSRLREGVLELHLLL